MPEIPFHELPGLSGLFCDYAEGRALLAGTVLPPPDFGNLVRYSKGVREDGRAAVREFLQCVVPMATAEISAGLSSEGLVVVWTTVAADGGGGHLSDFLKALTAAALSRKLRTESVPAIAVVWVSAPDPGVPPRFVAPDAEGRLVSIEPPDGTASASFAAQEVSALLGPDADKDALELLCVSESPADTTRAFARFLTRHLGNSGTIVLDSSAAALFAEPPAGTVRASDGLFQAGWRSQARSLSSSGYLQDATPVIGAPGIAIRLPVAAIVSGPEDIGQAICWASGAESARAHPVIPWPRLSATLLDSRSRKMLARHGLQLQDLFAGPESVLDRLGFTDAPGRTLAELEAIEESIRRRLLSLASASVAGLEKDVETAGSSLVYQVARLRDRFAPLVAQRLGSLRRQMGRLCNIAAPEGRLQESVLSLPWILRRFTITPSDLRLDRLDPCGLRHQVQEME